MQIIDVPVLPDTASLYVTAIKDVGYQKEKIYPTTQDGITY